MNKLITGVLLLMMLLLTACVETETKRTTKKVDASNAQIYETDMNKPRIRVLVSAPPELLTSVVNLLYVEIDDGVMHYRLPGGVMLPDSSGREGALYSPWLNTPDSGEVAFSFGIADDSGANVVSDRMTMDLRKDWLWEIEVGFYGRDRCSDSVDWPLCRSYSLPRSLMVSEDDALYVVWCGEALDSSTAAESGG